ncbi:MAG TPA: LysM peptidoglycan-binding domain-containing protein [Bacteroidales bacterium]|nr:LysM peptidoglycan-binding domain-containing protein [Bacteroidales bacterium]
MNRKLLIALCGIFILLLRTEQSAMPQIVVKRSETKVSIGGIPYYVHIVGTTETLYSIARAYNVSTETITRENQEALYGLQVGQALKIPVIEDNQEVERERDTEKFIYHILQRGETIYSLSRKYDVPEDRINESNPGIGIYDLPLGAEIAIPKKPFMEQPTYFRNDQEGFILHRVKRGETLSSIARQYDVSIRELRNANRRLVFPRVNEYIRIPGQGREVENQIDEAFYEEELNLDDPSLTDDEKITYLFDGTPVDYTPVEDLSGSVKVALLLPLYIEENSQRTYIDSSEYRSGKRIYKTVKRAEEWIYPRSELFIEFYEGVLLAVDMLREKSLDIDISVFDTAADSAVVNRLISTGRLRGMDLIIGPVYSYNVEQVARYARNYRIPVVSPLATRDPNILSTNPYLFKVQPSQEVVQEAIASKVSDYYDHNIILVNSDTVWNKDLSSGFKNKIFREMRYTIPIDEINFKQVFFTSRSAYNDTINVLGHAMSNVMPNLVIIDSDDLAVMSEVLVNVHTLLRYYDIKVIGYPEIQWLDNLDPIYFYELELMLLTPNWIDYNQQDVKNFISRYREKFKMEPPVRSYAWQSFDIAYYFISGIALNGNDFKYRPDNHNPDLLQVAYRFKRTSIFGGFENRKLYLIRFTPDFNVEFIR